jgi:transposase
MASSRSQAGLVALASGPRCCSPTAATTTTSTAASCAHAGSNRRSPGVEHGSGLGRKRWALERGFAWLHNLRRLRARSERLPELHLAFLLLGCAVICQRMLGWPSELFL